MNEKLALVSKNMPELMPGFGELRPRIRLARAGAKYNNVSPSYISSIWQPYISLFSAWNYTFVGDKNIQLIHVYFSSLFIFGTFILPGRNHSCTTHFHRYLVLDGSRIKSKKADSATSFILIDNINVSVVALFQHFAFCQCV
jgi:hypothetical protein